MFWKTLILIFCLVVQFDDHLNLEEDQLYDVRITPRKIYRKSKNLKRSRPIGYYSNSDATKQIILSGDIETNPGPAKNLNQGQNKNKSKAPKCNKCEKTIRSNSKSLECLHCKTLTHFKCNNHVTWLNTKSTIQQWTCSTCESRELPFFNCRDLNTSNISTTTSKDADYENEHIEKLEELKKHISISHLNTQSMTSTFDEFQLMVHQTNFDIITLSETWLKNDRHLLEYVELPGYNFTYRNRDERRGGGVGIYIKDTIQFKVRNDITNVNTSIEHLWIEVKGKNKHSSYLIGVFYQPSSEAKHKLEWIGKLDGVLSYVKSIWNSSVIPLKNIFRKDKKVK